METLTQINSFEDACQVLGLDPETVIPDFSLFPTRDHAAMIAHAKLIIIARAANKLANDGQEWTPDWDDYDQYKYHPWFEMEGGSSGFLFGGYDSWRSFSFVGSRLCFISREVAEHIGKTFQDLYRDYFVI